MTTCLQHSQSYKYSHPIRHYLFGKGGRTLTMASLFALTLTGCSKQEAPPTEAVRPVKLFTVSDRTNGDIHSFPARVASSEESQISFRIAGKLIEFPVKNAQEVKKGDLLGRLDDRDIKNQLDLRQADYDLAQVQYKRMKELKEKQVVSASELDKAEADLKSAKALLKLAEDQLSYTILTAPFDGRIARTEVENHQSVKAQQPILLLQNSQLLDITIEMPASILARINQETVNPDYKPYATFSSQPGKKYEITYSEHDTTVSSGTQSYKVTFTMPAPKSLRVYSGMASTVHLDLLRLTSYSDDLSNIVVPLTSVQHDDATGKMSAWVYNPESHTVKPVAVTVGRITQHGINVLSGLNDGEQIVTAGLSSLSVGMKVAPLVQERGL